jgi:pimeloyl-ACP methyl ester carboxylesterase
MKDVLVLAHGAFHGPWCWGLLCERLEARGISCVPVDLNRGGLEPDREVLQSAVDAARAEGARVHAIGHSLGCASVQALEPETLATAILLAGSAAPGPGIPSESALLTGDFLERLIPQADGRVAIEREHARSAFYLRCRDEVAEWALDQLRPTFVYGMARRSPPFWECLPVTYIGCEDDGVVSPEYQRTVCEQLRFGTMIDSDHSPMLGQPDALAELVLEAIGRA